MRTYIFAPPLARHEGVEVSFPTADIAALIKFNASVCVEAAGFSASSAFRPVLVYSNCYVCVCLLMGLSPHPAESKMKGCQRKLPDYSRNFSNQTELSSLILFCEWVRKSLCPDRTVYFRIQLLFGNIGLIVLPPSNTPPVSTIGVCHLDI